MAQSQEISQAKGRPMLHWVGKKPLSKVEYYPAQEKEVYGNKDAKWFNRLYWGDNLQVLSHLLKDFRNKIDLIYIDPPFDSKADYVKKVKIRGEKVDGVQQSLIEEKQYTDIWNNDEYLQFMYERLLLMKELLSEKGLIFVHCDWHKNAHIRLLLDEIFDASNFRNEIIARRVNKNLQGQFETLTSLNSFGDTVYVYAKSQSAKFNTPVKEFYRKGYWHSFKQPADRPTLRYKLLDVEITNGQWMWNEERANRAVSNYIDYEKNHQNDISLDDFSLKNPEKEFIRLGGNRMPEYFLPPEKQLVCDTLWDDVVAYDYSSDYPTAKSELFLKRVIEMASNKGDLVADFFCGSGVAMAVAQELERKWIGCDINIGAIQTSTKKLIENITNNSTIAFKVFNVNDYDVFKNEIEAKEIVMEMYGIESIKRTYFDGLLDNNFVKVMPMNRVLNKLDIKNVIKNVGDKISDFIAKKTSKADEETFEEGVIVICSGMELDVLDYLKKENHTGVKIEVRDILTDKQNLVFKQKPEAKVEAKQKNDKLTVKINEFYSPILIRKLEIENEKVLKKGEKARVDDFKQIIDSVSIDVDYDGKLFNAEIIDVPHKKEVIKAEYSWDYKKSGSYDVAVKIVDVLGEEYFEVIKV